MGNQGGGGDHHPLKVIVAGRIRGGSGSVSATRQEEKGEGGLA
jgi:hypothetical protein